MRRHRSLMILAGGILLSLGPAVASASAERIFLAVVLLVPTWAYVAILMWPLPERRPKPVPLNSARHMPAPVEETQPLVKLSRAA